MAKRAFDDLDYVDDAYLSAVLNEEDDDDLQNGEEFQVSDVKYAYHLQLQEALMGSVVISHFNKTNVPSSILITEPPNETLKIEIMESESGESSKSFCEICAERKEKDEMFEIKTCTHSICSDCITRHAAVKIENSEGIVHCPGLNCDAVVELDSIRGMLPQGVIDLWEKMLCEEMIGAGQRFYCPFKDCSGMLVNDGDEEGGEEVIRESECPFCHRLFCAQCRVPWHSGVDCDEFQGLDEDERERDDLMVMKLATDQKWGRCPQCKFYVERTQGCPHITCRCKFQFCYGCGSEWTLDHGGCQRK
ncbi:RING/U-box superfamily protein [Euphorbia peplus]|nr:RING/U-box superfamily protein [Euphorbia peplus]